VAGRERIMDKRVLDLLSLALFIGGAGLLLFLIGIGLGKLFSTAKKIHERGLDRPLNLSIYEQFVLYIHYPDISIPLTLAFFGGFMLFVSIIIAIIGIIQKFMV
jgi:hypothetical protein